MNIHTTTVPSHFTDIMALRPPKIAPNRYAHRVAFKPVGSNPGLCAKVPVPNEGHIRSIAVQLDGQEPAGEILLSIVDPAVSYDGCFLYAVLERIPVSQLGPKMWRRTDIHGVSYSSNQGTQGFVYLLILGGGQQETLADVALTVETD